MIRIGREIQCLPCAGFLLKDPFKSKGQLFYYTRNYLLL